MTETDIKKRETFQYFFWGKTIARQLIFFLSKLYLKLSPRKENNYFHISLEHGGEIITMTVTVGTVTSVPSDENGLAQ